MLTKHHVTYALCVGLCHYHQHRSHAKRCPSSSVVDLTQLPCISHRGGRRIKRRRQRRRCCDGASRGGEEWKKRQRRRRRRCNGACHGGEEWRSQLRRVRRFHARITSNPGSTGASSASSSQQRWRRSTFIYIIVFAWKRVSKDIIPVFIPVFRCICLMLHYMCVCFVSVCVWV